jgi:hypothetical protein
VLIVKWDLENDLPMKGWASTALRRLIWDLQDEGQL